MTCIAGSWPTTTTRTRRTGRRRRLWSMRFRSRRRPSNGLTHGPERADIRLRGQPSPRPETWKHGLLDRRGREVVRRTGHDHQPSVAEAGRELAGTLLQREQRIKLSGEHERGSLYPPNERPIVSAQPRLELGDHQCRIVRGSHEARAEQPTERPVEDALRPGSSPQWAGTLRMPAATGRHGRRQ